MTFKVGAALPPPPPPFSRQKELYPSILSLTTTESTEPSLKSGASIVEERRRAAIAIYESTDVADELQKSSSYSSSYALPTPRNENSLPIVTLPTPLLSIENTNINDTTIPRSSKTSNDKRNLVVMVPEPVDVEMTRDTSTITPKTPTAGRVPSSTRTVVDTPPSKLPLQLNPESSRNSTPDSKKKRGFFKKILSGRKKDKDSSVAAVKTNSGNKRGKNNAPMLGRPQNAKPGSSYMSTPHSAEIVLRMTSDTPSQATAPIFDFKEDPDPVQLAVSTSFEEALQMEMMVSFSPPRFDHDGQENDKYIMEAASTFPLNNSRYITDDISSMTEPMDFLTPQRQPYNVVKKMQPLNEEEPASDPFGHYWDGGKAVKTKFDVDPFEDPFFKEMEERMPLSPGGMVILDPPLNILDDTFGDSDSEPDAPLPSPSPSSHQSFESITHGIYLAKEQPTMGLVNEDSPNPPPPPSRGVEDFAISATQSEEQYLLQLPVAYSPPADERVTIKKKSSYEDVIRKKQEHRKAHKDQTIQKPLSNDSAIENTNHPSTKNLASSNPIWLEASHVPVPPKQEGRGGDAVTMKRRPSIDKIIRMSKEHRDAHKVQSMHRHPSNETKIDLSRPFTKESNAYIHSQVKSDEHEKFPSTDHSHTLHGVHSSATTVKALAYIRKTSNRQSPSRFHSYASKTESAESGTQPVIGDLRRSCPSPNSPAKPLINKDSTNNLMAKFAKQRRKPVLVTDASSTSYANSRANGFPSAFSSHTTSRLARTTKSNELSPTLSTTKEYRPLIVDHINVVKGVAAKAKKRHNLIERGVSTKVVPAPSKIKPCTYSEQLREADMDPIQRAGFRLLSKAAVPIQSGIRRYLSQKAAVDRMWAIIEVQSYFRRWRCEAFLIAHISSVTTIAATFRGWKARDALDEKHYCAIEIQKIVRGYLAACKVYDDLYRVVVIQSAFRGMIGRKEASQKLRFIVMIQSLYRSFQSRQLVKAFHTSATAIQSRYRSYSAQLHFQFDVVDIIIVQSLARRWRAQKQSFQMKIIIRTKAATTIQAGWRGFKAYTDFIFAIADVLVVQRTVRKWLAIKTSQGMREKRSATLIQSQWRRYTDQMSALYKLIHIIIAQSIIRRHIACERVKQIRIKMSCEEVASVKIQAAWRKFWQYSHYLILQYEIVRVQALFRGHRSRITARLQLGCAIIIQAAVRRFLAVKTVDELKFSNVLVASASVGMRENIASRNIAKGLRHFLLLRRQDQAARIIEKFFIRVKEEVDREVRRQEKKKATKKKRQKKEADEKLLERVWLNTVDDDAQPTQFQEMQRSKSTPRGGTGQMEDPRWRRVNNYENGYGHAVIHRAPVGPPTLAVNVRHADDVSELSAPSIVHHQATALSRYTTLSRKEMSDDLSLEEAWIDTEIRQVKERRRTEDEYMQRNGLQYHNSYHGNLNHRQYHADGQHMKKGDPRHHTSTMRHEHPSFQASKLRDHSPRVSRSGEYIRQPHTFDSSTRKNASQRTSATQRYYSPGEKRHSNNNYSESPVARKAAGVHHGLGGEGYHYPENVHNSLHPIHYQSNDTPFLQHRSPARPRSRGRSVSHEMYSGEYASHGQDSRTGYHRP